MLANFKSYALALGIAFTGLQVVQPSAKTQAPARCLNSSHLENTVGPQVGAIIERSCKDCHSNETAWPWYSHIAPVSWIISKHVTQGRQKLNFSEWQAGKQTANQMAEICDAVSDGSMPIRGYTVLHRDAKLSTRVAHNQPPLR